MNPDEKPLKVVACRHCGELPWLIEEPMRWIASCENSLCAERPKTRPQVDARCAALVWNSISAPEENRWTSAADAGSREAPGESSGADSLSRLTGRMPSVCAYCGGTYGHKPCVPEMDGKESHGVCAACLPAAMAVMEREVEFCCREGVGARRSLPTEHTEHTENTEGAKL